MLREGRLRAAPPAARRQGEKPFWSEGHRAPEAMEMPISAIMTSPAISADEETPVADLCRIMWNLRIHRRQIFFRPHQVECAQRLPNLILPRRDDGHRTARGHARAILDGTIRT